MKYLYADQQVAWLGILSAQEKAGVGKW